jgi:hypothetical protein
MVSGKDYDTARHLACEAEYKLRAKSGDPRRVAPRGSLPQAERVHLRLRKKLTPGTRLNFQGPVLIDRDGAGFYEVQPTRLWI